MRWRRSWPGRLRRLFQDRGLDDHRAGDRQARVRVDHQDLAEMLGNLMENACKWAGGEVTLEVAREARGRRAIADDGPGLTGQQRAMALARGVRLDEAAPGSGLGLAIVADLADALRRLPGAGGGEAGRPARPCCACRVAERR